MAKIGVNERLKVIEERLDSIEQRLEYVEGRHRHSADYNTGKPRVPMSKRIKEVEDFLRANGPSTRGQLLLGIGIPPGTLSFVLNTDMFARSDSGTWYFTFSER